MMIVRVIRIFGAQRRQIRRLIFLRQEAEKMAEWQEEYNATMKGVESIQMDNLSTGFKDQRYHTPSSIMKGIY